MISRKTIGFVVAIIAAILTVFQKEFGISLDPVAISAGIGAVLTYVFFEAKLDLKVLTAQPGKWKDLKFWITVISAVLVAIESTAHLGIPVESIVAVLTLIVGLLFGAKLKQEKAY